MYCNVEMENNKTQFALPHNMRSSEIAASLTNDESVDFASLRFFS